eukprot:14754076-Heterocapsa_arctica.AAC.1
MVPSITTFGDWSDSDVWRSGVTARVSSGIVSVASGRRGRLRSRALISAAFASANNAVASAFSLK